MRNHSSPSVWLRPPTSWTKRSSRDAPGADLVHRPGGEQPPGGDDGDVVAHPLDQVHDVAGDDDGAAGSHVAVQDVADVGGGDRVHGFERLVQHQQPGRVDQRRGEGDLLGHAGGVVHHQRSGVGAQVQGGEQFPDACGHHVLVHAAQQAGVADQLLAGQPVEEPDAVREDAHQLLGLQRLRPDVHAVHERRAEVGPQQPGGHRQRGGLAGAVRADDPVEGTGRNVQADAVDGDLVAEALGEPAQGQGGNGVARLVFGAGGCGCWKVMSLD